jgi:type II secretory pathway pseudopilin PulG
MVGMGRRQQQGASLVEVLVVIGILAIAILAFIRLYPSGFLALKRSGQSDAATRYAQQELERLKTRADNLPRAIVPIRYVREGNTPALRVDASVSPDDLSQQPDLPQGVPALYASGVNRFRRIVGERVPLGLPGPTLGRRDQLTEGIVYTTLFAPIAQRPTVGAENNYRDYLVVTGAPMRRLILNSDFQQPNIRLYEYGIDYDAAKVLLRPLLNEPVEYQVEYTVVYQTDSRLETRFVTEVIQFPRTNPNSPEPQWRDLGLAGLPRGRVLGIVPYSDVVARRFVQLEPNAPWSPVNPYQYKILNLLTGTILINPLASGYYERYWRGTRPLEAYVSYYVHDWSIIREEFTVPSSGRIRLAFSDLKQYDDLLDDQTQYRGLGLGRDVANEPVRADLIIVDMLTGRAAYFRQGQQIPDDELATPLRAQTLPNLNATIDYATGNLQIGNPQMQGRKIRVFYKVHENWAISVQKAANRYYLVQNRAAMTYDTCWYDLGAVLDRELTESARRLYFTRSEAGKTILLREYWYDVDDDPDNGNTQRGTNGVFRISEVPDETELVYIDLRDVHPNAVRWDPSVTGQAVRGVQGLSVKVRVTHEPPGRRTRTDFDILLPVRD